LTDPYSELVRQYFANPVHAGRLPDQYNDGIAVEAAESGTGTQVELSAITDGKTISILRYRIFGCPHLIAAAEAFCAEAEGRPVAVLKQMDVPGLMDRLAVPVEKTGRMFILEDAARALHIMVTEKRLAED
jgi:NifU-like protein involved in Fe-S cluster formation